MVPFTKFLIRIRDPIESSGDNGKAIKVFIVMIRARSN